MVSQQKAPTKAPINVLPPKIPIAPQIWLSITRLTSAFKTKVIKLFAIWTIPQEAAGDTGRKFIPANVYPIPRIGIMINPKSAKLRTTKVLFSVGRAMHTIPKAKKIATRIDTY